MASNNYIPGRIDVISMGCSKNLVDSERLLFRLKEKGLTPVHDSPNPRGEWVMVNTCGFIGDAKEESVNIILELAEAKKRGEIGNLAVMGCLSERYLEELKAEIPEVDRWYGKFNWNNFLSDLPQYGTGEFQLPETGSIEPRIPKTSNPESSTSQLNIGWQRSLTTPPWSAYVKISEGCNRFCAFCAIPLITGRHKSRPVEEILEEVRVLVESGVKEFNIIAQDLSSYGLDLEKRHLLPDLIDKMAQIPGVEWIRLHYAYPADFPWDIMPIMRKHPNVCNYLDIALQHISDNVLSNMRRHITKEETLSLINRLRTEVPGIRIRTTLMTGFPGEGDAEFQELLDFVREVKFDRMGAFAYCEEEDTWAALNLKDEVPEKTKKNRLDQLMALQEEISLDLNHRLLGETVKVLIERVENGNSIGRTEWDSPEVDPEVIIENYEGTPGQFVDVRITQALPFELIAVIL